MPLGASRIAFLAKTQITVVAEVIRKKKDASALGNAQIDTAQSKFGGASALFDGTGDYLLLNHDLALGSGDWTIETWLRPNDNSSNQAIFDGRPLSTNGAYPLLSFNAGTLRYFVNGTEVLTGTTSLSTGTWYHVAVVKNSGTLKLYVNGSEDDSVADSVTYLSPGYAVVGISGSTRTSIPLNGHLDELRVSTTARYTTGFTPSTTPFVNDDDTKLLLHMDGTDASTYFPDDNGVRAPVGVSAIGNAQIDTAQSQFGGSSSNYGAGSGNYLQLGDTTPFAFGNNDWTIEMWFRLADTSGLAFLWDTRPTSTNGSYSTIYVTGSTLYYYRSGNRISTTVSATTWYHLAVTYDSSSGDHKMYLDGTQVGSTYTASITYAAGNAVIGYSSYNNNYSMDGHIDEVRVSDTLRYTTGFIPSTAPFQNDANTLLLVHMNGTDASTDFPDDNGYHITGKTANHISVYGDAQVDTGQSYFGGSSLLLDGTTDQLRVTNSNFAFGSSDDFTIEGWVRQTTSGNDGMFHLDTGFYTSTETGLAIAPRIDLGAWIYYAGAKYTVSSPSTTPATNTWYHVALVRNSGTLKLYVNGTEEDSRSDSNSYTGTNLLIGGYYGSGFLMAGNIDEFRVSDVARYTAGFTVPTSAFTNDANTLLLLHMDGPDGSTIFRDDIGGRSRNGISAVGNAQVDTGQSQFGGASALFDGAGDYLITNGPNLGSGTWTLEMWARFDSVSGVRVLYDDRESANTATGTILLYTNGTTLYYNSQQANRISGATLAINTWYHIAVVRDSSNDIKMYLDGTQIGSSWNDSSTYSQQDGNGFFGMNHQSPNNHYFDGYIEEVRFSNTARYTSGFTSSTEPFQNDANTLLLLHMDGTDGSTTFTDDNGTYTE